MKNIITIDPSINSTALVVNGVIFTFCPKDEAEGKNGKLKKWYKLASGLINYRYVDYTYKNVENYSEREILKTVEYDKATDIIIDTILEQIDKNLENIIYIEGYSYGSGSDSSIIDLVNFSSILRRKLYLNFDYKNINILAPTELKLNSCILTYPPVNEGKKKEKWVYRNDIGVAGGKFTKREICISLMDNEKYGNYTYLQHLKHNRDVILDSTKINKPYEDANDAYTLYLCVLNSQI
jgi:hypothetical protein